jgi:hypothetical protein
VYRPLLDCMGGCLKYMHYCTSASPGIMFRPPDQQYHNLLRHRSDVGPHVGPRVNKTNRNSAGFGPNLALVPTRSPLQCSKVTLSVSPSKTTMKTTLSTLMYRT